jgi:hypothetical protein
MFRFRIVSDRPAWSRAWYAAAAGAILMTMSALLGWSAFAAGAVVICLGLLVAPHVTITDEN